ncbi:MAG: phosphatidylinositol-specific phospholipase C domain-containing protein [Hyphomicrobiales bacterium]
MIKSLKSIYLNRYILFLSILSVISMSCRKSEIPSGNNNHVVQKTVANPTEYKDVQFGLSTFYDNGNSTDVAMNKYNRIVEVHKSQGANTIWYRVGNLYRNHINWGSSKQYDTGISPTVAANDNNVVVEIHKSHSWFSSGLWYHVGTLYSSSVVFGGSHKFDSGSDPCVALNNNNVVVEVHKSQGNYGLWYHVGIVNPTTKTISWGKSYKYDNGGMNPSIAINNNNIAVEVHQAPTSGRVWYRVGRIDTRSKTINWSNSVNYQSGAQPDVTLLDDGTVIEVHASEGLNDNLWRMMGKVNGNRIDWTSVGEYFDDGTNPSVTANNISAVQTHDGEGLSTGLFASSSLITDHSNWMHNIMGHIGNKPLNDIVVPGSHDAAMYDLSFGQTQDHNIYNQLKGGVRYFDLRPNGNLNMYHGPVTGPHVDAILSNVKSFMDEGRNELVMLKFSHFKDFNSEVYKSLVNKIKNKLGDYLYVNNTGKRLGDITMNEYLNDGGKVLIFMDGSFPVTYREDGIYVYRDNYNSVCTDGDIVLYDSYSDMKNYESMRDDQLQKFQRFNGVANDGSTADMFLLSWTVTPITGVWLFCKGANANLMYEMNKIQRNRYGKIPNILYVDFYEYARVTDASIIMNKRF